MSKLGKNIIPDLFRGRERGQNLSLREDGVEKGFQCSPTVARQGLESLSPVNDVVLETFRAAIQLFAPGHLALFSDRFSCYLDDIHGEIDHGGVADGGSHPIGVHMRVQGLDFIFIHPATDENLNM
jgi:hypothetical protein